MNGNISLVAMRYRFPDAFQDLISGSVNQCGVKISDAILNLFYFAEIHGVDSCSAYLLKLSGAPL